MNPIFRFQLTGPLENPLPPPPPPPPPPPAPPTITLHPANVTVTEPAQATFTVAGVGYTTIQWRQTPAGGGTFADISGSVAGSHTTGATSVAGDNARRFLARLTGPGGTTDSNEAILTVNPAPTPPPPPPPPPPAPTGNITQYLTSDGGTEAYSGNFSGPTKDLWHRRMGIAWKRMPTSGPLVGRGNWLDSAQTAEGSVPYASTNVATTVGQTLSATVTSLVQRWINTGLNRGFYLNARGTPWPLDLYGRGATISSNRPKLVITTTTGTFTLTSAANASWAISSFTASPGKNGFRIAADSQPAIVRFDLSSVTGTVTSAVFSVVVSAFDTGHTGHIIDVFEADPPTLIDPVTVTSPVTGLLNGYTSFNAFKAAGLSSVILADDFASPGPFDTGFTPSADRILDSSTNTTYARGTISAGANGSVSNKQNISTGSGPRGTPSVVYDRLFAHYAFKMENDFGTTQDDAIKIPAVGVQFGIWNPVGYWQQTTGNGGAIGTGLKVDNGGGSNYEYQGHSVRFLTGTDARTNDDDPYRGWFGLQVYPYNLDQGGVNPSSEAFPSVVIRRGARYVFDIEVQQNTMTGAQDALGNYATANADGVYRVWINGYLAYEKTSFRWRRHAEMGVEFLWLDVYHGGTTTAPQDMHYQLDEVAVATSFIGPKVTALPSYVPNPGEVGVLTVANGKLANSFISQCAPYYDPFYFPKTTNSYGGGIKNQYWGTYGCTLHYSGGHSNTNDSSVTISEYGATQVTFRRITDPIPWWGQGTDATTQGNNANGDIQSKIDWIGGIVGGTMNYGEAINLTGTDAAWNGQPGASHQYGLGVVIGPESGGATYGTFLTVQQPAVGRQNHKGAISAHALALSSTTAASSTRFWSRHTNNRRDEGPVTWGAPGFATYVPAQNRVYISHRATGSPPPLRWYDVALGDWVEGTGNPFLLYTAEGLGGDIETGCQFFVPSRNLLICCFSVSPTTVAIEWMDVSVSQPTRGGRASLSMTLSTARLPSDPEFGAKSSWGAATWCPDNNRIILAGVAQDNAAAYEVEIPATLTDTWTVTRAPYGSGQTFFPNGATTHQKFQYDHKLKSIYWFPTSAAGVPDTAWIYRPRGT